MLKHVLAEYGELLFAIPIALLAAVLERPFVSAAGVRRNALAHSIRANLLSSLLVLSCLLALAYSGSGVSLPVLILAIPISVLVEGGYYRAVLKRGGGDLDWGFIFGANLTSPICIVVLLAVPCFCWIDSLRVGAMLASLGDARLWVLGAVSVVLLLFALRPLRDRRQPAPEARQAIGETKTPPEEVYPHDSPARADDPREPLAVLR